MDELTCDECGTINDGDRSRCELCGDPLGEERREAEQGSLWGLLPAALFATVLSYGGGLGLFGVAYWRLQVSASVDVHGRGAWIRGVEFGELTWVYSAIWLVGVLVAHRFEPRENPDFGGGVHAGGVGGNPFSLRDDVARGRAYVGCLLAPLTIVSGLWRRVFERLREG